MPDIVFQRLEQFAELSVEERRYLDVRMQRVEQVPARTDVVQRESHPRYLNIILEGWACRYKQLKDGRRQIIALFLPGDVCDPCVFLLGQPSHVLATLTPVRFVRIAETDMLDVMSASPGLSKAFWLEMLLTAEVQREWTVNVGRRTAVERMAHLFCELLLRMRAVGLTDGSECELPITQADLGDALGLSAVHVNRTLQELRSTKLVEVRGKWLVVRDEATLQALALFNPSYLHHQRFPTRKADTHVDR